MLTTIKIIIVIINRREMINLMIFCYIKYDNNMKERDCRCCLEMKNISTEIILNEQINIFPHLINKFTN
jgi:hypothetical protein